VHQAEFRISTMCYVLRVSRSGYYSWLRRGSSRWVQADRQLLPRIQQIYEDSHGRYGVHRIRAALQRCGIRVSPRRISRLMAAAGIRGGARRNRINTTRADGATVATDLVQREFRADRPNQIWVADATYVPTQEGTLYLAVIKDVFSRKIVGWSTSARQGSELMVRALQQAVSERRPQRSVIHHSDHGSQYTSTAFQAVCQAANITPSMGAVGNCYDNAMAESFFASLEKELIHQQHRRRFTTRADAELKIFEYIEGFYNRTRLHSALDFRSPVEFEQAHHKEVAT